MKTEEKNFPLFNYHFLLENGIRKRIFNCFNNFSNTFCVFSIVSTVYHFHKKTIREIFLDNGKCFLRSIQISNHLNLIISQFVCLQVFGLLVFRIASLCMVKSAKNIKMDIKFLF